MSLIVLIFALFVQSVSMENETLTEADLHRHLFEYYNPDIMPLRNKSEPIEVSVDLYVMNIDNIDEKSQTFTIRAFLENSWKDEFLTWDQKQYGGIKSINVQNKNIWLPDLALNNVYDSPTELGQKDGRTIVKHTGQTVTWPYKMYQVGCKIHIRNFPFDVQTCELDFLSWTNPFSVLKLKTSEKLSMHYFRESAEWSLESYKISHYQNPYGDDSWDHILFSFILRRKWLFQVLNMMAPIVCISFLNLTCFIIPSECGEKITLCISIFLTLAVFLTIISNALPESSDETSLFGVYVGLQLLLSGLTILSTVISLHLYHKERQENIPLFFRLLSKLLCRPTEAKDSESQSYSNGHIATVEHPPDNHSLKYFTDKNISWISVSRAFDRFCLLLSIIWNLALIVGLVTAFQS